MSVTFSTNPEPTVTSTYLKCWDVMDLRIPTTLETASADGATHSLECPECMNYQGPVIEYTREVSEVQLSNTNAYMLLESLGLDGEIFGQIPSEEFTGRALLAMALLPSDDGMETFQEGNIVYGGRQPGYTQDKLSKLIELSNWATKHKAEVTWG
jgi:hypothetical protein